MDEGAHSYGWLKWVIGACLIALVTAVCQAVTPILVEAVSARISRGQSPKPEPNSPPPPPEPPDESLPGRKSARIKGDSEIPVYRSGAGALSRTGEIVCNIQGGTLVVVVGLVESGQVMKIEWKEEGQPNVVRTGYLSKFDVEHTKP